MLGTTILNGQLGDGSTNDSASPVSVNLGSGNYGPPALQPVADYTCALVQNSSIACWGHECMLVNLGDNSTSSSTSPVYPHLPAGRTATEISAASIHDLRDYSTTASAAMCWGARRCVVGSVMRRPDPHLPTRPYRYTSPFPQSAPPRQFRWATITVVRSSTTASAMCWGTCRDTVPSVTGRVTPMTGLGPTR